MDKFACVQFGKDEIEQQREFLQAMNGAEIIEISKEQLNEWTAEEMKLGAGSENHLVLHGEDEVNRFKCVMSAFFPDREYKITDNPQSKEFSEWLRKKRESK